MPRGRSGGMGGGGMRSAPARRPSPLPARAPARQAPPPPAAGGGGPGLMGQMAATAGGVAIGSAIGHTVGHMMTGGGGGSSEQPAQQQQQQDGGAAMQQQYQQQPCEFEMKQFLDCSNRNDLSACEAFNQALKDCRMRYGI